MYSGSDLLVKELIRLEKDIHITYILFSRVVSIQGQKDR